MSLTVLITGAARGIGLALAQIHATQGDGVIATARNPAAPQLAQLSTSYPNLATAFLDVTEEVSIAGLAANLAGQPLDLLICNAGIIGTRDGLGGYTNKLWAEVLATNVTGVFQTVQALLPNLERARTAKIAIISSSMGSSARPGGAYYAYRASKAAASNIAANLAVDLKSKGIAVGAYHPGWVRTDMGGPNATLDVMTSARGLASRIDKLSLATTGVFEDYQGTPIPY